MTKNLLPALFVAFLSVGLAGCGDSGGGSIASACDHVCDCAVSAGLLPEAMRASCETDCETEAAADNPSQECVDCVNGAPCASILDGTACPVCETSDAGAAPRASWARRVHTVEP